MHAWVPAPYHLIQRLGRTVFRTVIHLHMPSVGVATVRDSAGNVFALGTIFLTKRYSAIRC